MANTCPAGQVHDNKDRCILDLPANRGYLAKEMLSSRGLSACIDRQLPVTKIAHAELPYSFDAAISVLGRPDTVALANKRCVCS